MRSWRWLCIWLMLTTMGSWAGIAALDPTGAGGVVIVMANLASVLTLPVWVVIVGVGFAGATGAPAWIVAANAVAWAGWLFCAWAVCWFRAQWRRGGLPRSPRSGGLSSPTPPTPPGPPDPSRRSFLADSAAGVVGVGLLSAPVYATAVEPWNLQVRRYEIPVRDLPENLSGLRIVQFSDPHLGRRIPADFVASAVRTAVELKPDLAALTGDYIASGEDYIDRAAELLRPLVEASAMGAVGVLGNHDWYGNGARVAGALRAVGVEMIDNDRRWLDGVTRRLGRTPRAGSLAVVGLADLSEDTIDLGRAFGGIDDGTPRVVLAHQPDTAETPGLRDAGAPRVDLMLSGHTHGGQVRIPLLGTPLIPSNYGQKYAGGLVAGPRFPVLVSRGVGMTMLPVRLGVPPEISLIILVSG